MTTRMTHDLEGLDRDTVRQWVKFYPAGSSAPTSVSGKGVTVARSAGGTFTLTFADNDGLTYLGARCTVNFDAVSDNVGAVGPYASNVLTVYNQAAGIATDIAADADRYVLVEILWRRRATAISGDGI